MAPRPGSEAASRLARLPDRPDLWRRIEEKYEEMLLAKGSKELKKLDVALDGIGVRLQGPQENKNAPCISKKELVQIMKWKLSKGKMRPLMKHIEKNTEAQVKKYSSSSFAMAMDNDDARGAVKEMANLKGVGPATASAILSLYRPGLFAFMDDEVIDSLYDGKRDYTLPIYMDVNANCIALAETLGTDWTPRRVGRALWTAARVLATGGDDLTLARHAKRSDVSENKSIHPKRRRRA